jgi:predicted MFS family arabinose efflux permease
MGLYSTCQFLGAFAGGAAGGWMLQHMSVAALIGVCLILAAVWWLLVLPAGQPSAGKQDQLSDA